jgi:hypothetical protein
MKLERVGILPFFYCCRTYPNNAIEIINVGLSLENTPLKLLLLNYWDLRLSSFDVDRALHEQSPWSQPLSSAPANWLMLAFGFETFACRQDTQAFSPPDGFQKTTRHR